MQELTRRALMSAALAATVPAPASAQARLPGLAAHLAAVRPTAFMVSRDGQRILQDGDVAQVVNVASVRKSLLGALYGIAVGQGRIGLSDTLERLGIDDLAPALSAQEKTAKVSDLLASRSGVYHVAAYETRQIRERRPARGSHAPGSFWFYNNWDFNALGSIYRERTGEDIFRSFEQRIARPLGLQDFAPSACRYVSDPRSRHPAYVFGLSARDMLRFGEMVLAAGRRDGREIVPAGWLADSLKPRSTTDRGDLGYGLLWWTLPPEVFGPGAGFAAGYGGQFIAVVPKRRLVAVQTVAARPDQSGATRRFVRVLRELVEAV